ncbi:MAG: TonB-dependent receptor [Bacteroidales bacterium]|nr:TonB-dependent receptor [Bacteroidales bacterium]
MLPLFDAFPEEDDTLRVHRLPVVEVIETATPSSSVSSFPVQTLSGIELDQINASQLSDAVKRFSGVTVKDYGGIGGMKTVSIRSLGANHTAVSYDGVTLNDCQTGQIDISRFTLTNVKLLSLTIGQNETIFQPAALFASAGVLSIVTRDPQFEPEKPVHVQAALKAGSFGYVMPSLRIEQKVSDRLSLTANAEWQKAEGDYPYALQNGDSTVYRNRSNSDINQINSELNIYYNLPSGGSLKAKGYGLWSDRGLPGAAKYYTDNYIQRLNDRNLFAQARYEQPFGRFALLVNSKYSYLYTRYTNEDPAQISEDDRYTQRISYLSVAGKMDVSSSWQTSVATDYTHQYLHTNYMTSGTPQRTTSQSVFAVSYVTKVINATGSALLTSVDEKVTLNKGGHDYIRLSPTFSLSASPGWKPLRLRAMYKENFRAPSFNDLYFERVGNRDLVPEKARQVNVGVTYADDFSGLLSYLSFTADTYYNRVDDKIVTVPRGNMFNWSVLNYGAVEIKGVELTMAADIDLITGHTLALSGGYTYQKAIDITEKTSRTYGDQLPYTPRHSCNGHASYTSPWFVVSYNMFASGKRYYLPQNKKTNEVEAYQEHSITLSHAFHIDQSTIHLQAECINMFDSNYELVRNFPMPGRSYRLSVSYNY